MSDQPQLPERDWPEARKMKAAGKTAWAYFSNLVKLLIEKLGEEKTCEILTELMTRNAQKFVPAGFHQFGIGDDDPWGIASYFKLATGDVIGYDAELIKDGEKVTYKLNPPCLWFPDLDVPPAVCRALGEFEREACRMVNPKVGVTITHLLTAGDPYCAFVFEKKED